MGQSLLLLLVTLTAAAHAQDAPGLGESPRFYSLARDPLIAGQLVVYGGSPVRRDRANAARFEPFCVGAANPVPCCDGAGSGNCPIYVDSQGTLQSWGGFATGPQVTPGRLGVHEAAGDGGSLLSIRPPPGGCVTGDRDILLSPADCRWPGLEIEGAAPTTVDVNGMVIGTRRILRFVAGANIVITGQDDPANDRIILTFDSTAGGATTTSTVSTTTSTTSTSSTSSTSTSSTTTSTVAGSTAENFTLRASCQGAWLVNDTTIAGAGSVDDLCADAGTQGGANVGDPTATPAVSTAVPAGSPGTFRSADLEFDEGDRITIADHDAFNVASMTICGWVNVEAFRSGGGAADAQTVLSKGSGFPGAWGLGLRPGDAGVSGGLFGEISNVVEDGATANTAGTWHHVCLRYSATTDQVELFRDAVTECSGSCVSQATGPQTNTTTPLAIGDAGALFDGQVHDLTVFAEALTNAEICSLCRCSSLGAAGGIPGGGRASLCNTCTLPSGVTECTGTWSDTFNRAAETLAGNWTQQTWEPSSATVDIGSATAANTILSNPGGFDALAAWTANDPTDDSHYAIGLLVGTPATNTWLGPATGILQSAGDGATCAVDQAGGQILLFSWNNGMGQTDVGPWATTGITGGDYVGMVRSGASSFRCFWCDTSASGCDEASDWIALGGGVQTVSNIDSGGFTGVYTATQEGGLLIDAFGAGNGTTLPAPNVGAPN